MATRSHEPTSKKAHVYKMGQRLYCQNCGSEIEIISPCPGTSHGQVLRCCGRDMSPEPGGSVHLESES